MKESEILFDSANAFVEQSYVKQTYRKTRTYLAHLQDVVERGQYTDAECSLNCSSDDDVQETVRRMVAKKCSDALKYCVVIGIGGSNLGTQAVYFALAERISSPQLLFLDTVDAIRMMHIVELLEKEIESKDEVLINIITKSGSTTETMVNAETLLSVLSQRFGDIVDRIVITTDEGSGLGDMAQLKGIDCLYIPKLLGGRFSVMSVVGQFPLAVARVDTDALLRGARDMRDVSIVQDVDKNPALNSAITIAGFHEMNISTHNLFVFNPELEHVGKWYRQLMSESIGKKDTTQGDEVREGIIPIVSVGSVDLHSMAQLYFGGPRSILTTFVYAPQLPTQVKVPETLMFPNLISDIEGKSFKKIMSALYEGVKSAYTHTNLPFLEISMKEIDEYALGQLLQLKMIEIMIVAYILKVNCFDQPSVEEYKKETRRFLSE